MECFYVVVFFLCMFKSGSTVPHKGNITPHMGVCVRGDARPDLRGVSTYRLTSVSWPALQGARHF